MGATDSYEGQATMAIVGSHEDVDLGMEPRLSGKEPSIVRLPRQMPSEV